MNWFENLKTRNKLLLAQGMVVLILGVAGGNIYQSLREVEASLQALYQKHFRNAVELKDIRANQNASRANLLAMALATDPAVLRALEEDTARRTRESSAHVAELLQRNQDNPVMLRSLEEFENVRRAQNTSRDEEIVPLLQQDRLDEARALILGIQEERNSRLAALADDMVERADAAAAEAVAVSEHEIGKDVQESMFAVIVVFLIAAASVTLLQQAIAVPLRRIAGVAERIAGGDLTVLPEESDRSDEVGMLNEAFRRMVEGLRKVMTEIVEGTNVLASAAGEIVATTTQVASSASETATAVTETTSTVEEVKKTAELSSDKARYVSETAQKAVQVSQDGRRAVDQSVEGINAVRRQMEALAQSIMKLSEQSQAIGEIIETVNDLAEQSNLLAVNAAIEAARAGEQGKGFSVVAQEIRSLAEQSKQATTQVRAILGDVQKATASSVLAAEQGSKAVDAGVRQATDAGEAIRLLAQSIAEAAQAATQIAASSQQQQVGMDQVAQAMDNIQEATAQNVAGTRQAETAAHDLSELGQRLKTLVAAYQV
jgi:methyl-accepting chemotaxis protein